MSTVSVTSELHGLPIVLEADSNYGGAITSLTWNGIQFVACPSGKQGDNGQQIQSAIHSYASPVNPDLGECYNPNEAGSFTDTGTSSTTALLEPLATSGTSIITEADIAFYATPGHKTNSCTTPLNTVPLSSVVLNKTVTLGFDASIPQAIRYNVSLQIPDTYNATYAENNSFEFAAWYLPNTGANTFNTFLQNNPVTGLNANVTSQVESEGSTGVTQPNYPVILSFGNADFAAGLYCPSVQPSANINYDQYTFSGNPNKLGIVAYINNIVPANEPTYSMEFYLVIGSLADVNSGLAALIVAFPPPVPNISYPADAYTFLSEENIPTITPTNTGGPISSYSINPNLTANTGLTFNAETGVISGTASKLSPVTDYLITPTGPGGAGTAFSIDISVVVAVSFTIDNKSNNSVDCTFYGIDGTSGQVSGVAEANSGVNPPVAVPAGTYEVVVSPAGTPENCNMLFNTGENASDTPGHTFPSITVGNSASNYLTLTNP
jgi:hypothetical protein